MDIHDEFKKRHKEYQKYLAAAHIHVKKRHKKRHHHINVFYYLSLPFTAFLLIPVGIKLFEVL